MPSHGYEMMCNVSGRTIAKHSSVRRPEKNISTDDSGVKNGGM
jgi:hypothetical protein